MANTINIPKPHLIMGLCLPLAVLIGYMLAEPGDTGSIAIVAMVLGVFATPILMRWYHPLLVFSWNACLVPYFLPGQPPIWVPMALLAVLFAVLNRCVNPYRHFIHVPSLTKPLVFFILVVVATGFATGGFGFRILGSATMGSKRYFYILAAIAGYFGFASQRIPPHRAGLYAGLFFLPTLLGLIPNLAAAAGGSFDFLFSLFPQGMADSQETGGSPIHVSIMRIGGFTVAGPGLAYYLLARYGVRGLLDTSKPWRGLLFLLAGGACAFSGFRTALILYGLTFAAMFVCEGLHRTRLMPLAVVFGLGGLGILFLGARHLPMTVQRAVSFLPVKVDMAARRDAEDSSRWRWEMWMQVLPQVPSHLLKGKGYTFDPQEMFFTVAAPHGSNLHGQAGASELAGDYHNGPLSVIMPFGLWGVAAFAWLMFATLRYLYFNHRFGAPELRSINTFLLALFAARLVIFVVVFGALNSDMWFFAGVAGFSVSLNGAPVTQPESEPVGESLNLLASGV